MRSHSRECENLIYQYVGFVRTQTMAKERVLLVENQQRRSKYLSKTKFCLLHLFLLTPKF